MFALRDVSQNLANLETAANFFNFKKIVRRSIIHPACLAAMQEAQSSAFSPPLPLLFLSGKRKVKGEAKEKIPPSSSPLFSFIFFFKKGKKGRGKSRCWRSRIFFFRHFCFIFCKKNGKRRAKRRELSFGSLFYFLEEKDEGESLPARRRASPLLCEMRNYERIKLKR